MLKPISRNNRNSILIAIVLLLPLFVFQNCYDLKSNKNLFSSGSGGGNGEGYDGKLLTHIRIVPGVVCENQSIPIGRIQIDRDTVSVQNLNNSCNSVIQNVPLTSLIRSEFSPAFVGFEGAVYTSFENNDVAIKDRTFTEAWCRGQVKEQNDRRMEIAIRWTESGRFAQMAVLDQDHRSLEWKTIERNLQPGQVTYKNESSSLHVSLLNRDPITQELKASYKHWDSNRIESATLDCFVGGQFDIEAPTFEYPELINLTLAIGEEFGPVRPTYNKQPDAFKLNASLPKGLNFDSRTGAISGKAIEISERQIYSIAAVFKFGEIDYQFSFGIGEIQVVDQSAIGTGDMACAHPEKDCSLTGAVSRSNLNPRLPLIVNLETESITLEGNEIVLAGDLTIRGKRLNSEISGNGKSRIFKLTPKAYLGIENLKISSGKAILGGCIYSVSNRIQIKNSIFSDCFAEKGFIGDRAYSKGGAIYMASGFLDIVDSVFIGNRTALESYDNQGGAIFIFVGTHSINNTKFTSNVSGSGGAIWAENLFGGHLNIKNSEFTNNQAKIGGAIATRFNGDFSITNSIFNDNIAAWSGSAIWSSETNHASVSNSKFSKNQSQTNEYLQSVIFWSGQAFSLFDSVFENNQPAPDTNGVLLYNHSGISYVKNSKFLENGNMVGCKVPAWADATNRIQIISLGGNFGCESK